MFIKFNTNLKTSIMKKLITYLIAVPLLLLSCQENEIIPSNTEVITQFKLDQRNFLTHDVIDMMNVKSFSAKSQFLARPSDNSSANGHFSTSEGNTISFSAGINNGGEYGRFNMSGIINIKGDVLCSFYDGNQVVIWVRTTHVGDLPDCGCEEYFAVGTSWLYLLEDNGEGANAPPDRYFSQALVLADENGPILDFDPVCDEFSFLGEDFFVFVFGGNQWWSDVAGKGDQIQVN